MNQMTIEAIKLPEPVYQSQVSIEEALVKRGSLREFISGSLSMEMVSQLLWAAQGITGEKGMRTTPSAGSLFPLEVYLVAADVETLEPGIYHYHRVLHELTIVTEGDQRRSLMQAAHMQMVIGQSPAILVIAADFNRTLFKYGPKGERLVHMEAGHAAQNVYLQAVSLNLGTVSIGSFDDDAVKKILALPDNENVLYLMPLGLKA